MNLRDCPAYWEYIPAFCSLPEDWGCLCQPELKDDFEHLEDDNEGCYYCNRTIDEINKAVKDFEEEQQRKYEELNRSLDNDNNSNNS